ncbi:MAG: Uncharacterized protein AWT59_3485, partial [Candidatus Gallionella acididurans]
MKELILNLRKDEVAKSLLTIKIESIANKFENKDTGLQEIATILDIIYPQIGLRLYKERTEKLLMEAVAEPKEKDRIRSLSRNYITTLINYGFSTRFLYPAVRMFFYMNKENITGPESIEGFFNIVKGGNQKYTAIFRVNSLFEEIKDSCKVFKVEIVTELNEKLTASANKKAFKLLDEEVYLIVNEITSKDVFSARDKAERLIDQISTLSSLFHHKEMANWQPNALLINLASGKERMVSASLNPMLMCADSRKENAAIKLR